MKKAKGATTLNATLATTQLALNKAKSSDKGMTLTDRPHKDKPTLHMQKINS